MESFGLAQMEDSAFTSADMRGRMWQVRDGLATFVLTPLTTFPRLGYNMHTKF